MTIRGKEQNFSDEASRVLENAKKVFRGKEQNFLDEASRVLENAKKVCLLF